MDKPTCAFRLDSGTWKTFLRFRRLLYQNWLALFIYITRRRRSSRHYYRYQYSRGGRRRSVS